MKTYPIKVIDLRFQLDYVNPKKLMLFEEYDEDPFDTILYVIIMKHREMKMVSEWNQISGVELICMTILNLKVFIKKYFLKKILCPKVICKSFTFFLYIPKLPEYN